MKRFIAIVSAFALACCLFGCASNANQPSDASMDKNASDIQQPDSKSKQDNKDKDKSSKDDKGSNASNSGNNNGNNNGSNNNGNNNSGNGGSNSGGSSSSNAEAAWLSIPEITDVINGSNLYDQYVQAVNDGNEEQANIVGEQIFEIARNARFIDVAPTSLQELQEDLDDLAQEIIDMHGAGVGYFSAMSNADQGQADRALMECNEDYYDVQEELYEFNNAYSVACNRYGIL